MKPVSIVAVVKNSLYKPAIKQVLHELNITEALEFHPNLSECLNGTMQPAYLIIESSCLTPPPAYTLERIGKKNHACKIMLLCDDCLPETTQAYLHDGIFISDSESKILSKFQSFFSDLTPSQSSDNTLSEREKEVIQLVAVGKTNKEISDALFISPHTVITHRKNITAKLGIKTIAGLVVYAVLNGLIDPDQVNR